MMCYFENIHTSHVRKEPTLSEPTTLTLDQLIQTLTTLRTTTPGTTPVVIAHVETDFDYNMENRYLSPIQTGNITVEDTVEADGYWEEPRGDDTGQPTVIIGEQVQGIFDHADADISLSSMEERRGFVQRLAKQSRRTLDGRDLSLREQLVAEDLEDEGVVECEYDEEHGGISRVTLIACEQDLTPAELDAFDRSDNQPDNTLSDADRRMAWHLADMGLIAKTGDGIWKQTMLLNPGHNHYLTKDTDNK